MNQRAGVSPLLRMLILAQIAVSLLGVAVALSDSPLLPPELRDYRAAAAQQPFTTTDGIQTVGYLLCGVLTIIGWVGLWRGSRFGARAYLASWLLWVPVTFFGRATVASAPSSTLAALAGLLAGAILGYAYHRDAPSTHSTEQA